MISYIDKIQTSIPGLLYNCKTNTLPKIIVQNYDAGETIYTAGERFDGLLVIKSGIVKMVAQDDIFLHTIASDGDVLGVDSLHSCTYTSNVTAVVDSQLIRIPLLWYKLLIRSSPEFRACLNDAIDKARTENVLMMRLLAIGSAEARVAYLLVKLAPSLPRKNPGRPKQFNIGLSRAEIADYLGIRTETLSRKLSLLSERGYVKVAGQRIQIRNYEGLRKICAPVVVPKNLS